MRRADLRRPETQGDCDGHKAPSDAELRGIADELLPILLACGECEGSGYLDGHGHGCDGSGTSEACRQVGCPFPCPSCGGSGHDPKAYHAMAGKQMDLVSADRDALRAWRTRSGPWERRPASDADLRSMDYQLLLVLLACAECGGSGTIHPSDGWDTATDPCPSCGGSGHDPKVRAMLVRMLIDETARARLKDSIVTDNPDLVIDMVFDALGGSDAN